MFKFDKLLIFWIYSPTHNVSIYCPSSFKILNLVHGMSASCRYAPGTSNIMTHLFFCAAIIAEFLNSPSNITIGDLAFSCGMNFLCGAPFACNMPFTFPHLLNLIRLTAHSACLFCHFQVCLDQVLPAHWCHVSVCIIWIRLLIIPLSPVIWVNMTLNLLVLRSFLSLFQIPFLLISLLHWVFCWMKMNVEMTMED